MLSAHQRSPDVGETGSPHPVQHHLSPVLGSGLESTPRSLASRGRPGPAGASEGAGAPLPSGAHPPSQPKAWLWPGRPGNQAGAQCGQRAAAAIRFLGAGKRSRRRDRRGAREGRGGGGGGRGNGEQLGAFWAQASAPRGPLAATVSIAPRSSRKWREWPRATDRVPRSPPPRWPPRARRRHGRRGSPGERGSRGRDPGREGGREGGKPPGSPVSLPSPHQVPPSAPGRRGGGCFSPLCNRGVEKCEKRALCYLFGSRKFMPS